MNFLFDIGNVLLRLDFPSFHRRVFGPGGLTPEAREELDLLKVPYEAGEMDDDTFFSSIRPLLPDERKGLTAPEFITAWNGIFSPNRPMWRVVDQLAAQGHRLILFSNTNSLHASYFLKEFSVFDHFRHHHFSQEIGALKPDRAFYDSAIEKFQLVPEETLYLDDLPENILTGRNLGFGCHQYHLEDHPAALDWLREKGFALPEND